LLPEKITKAHEDGVLFFHDSDYFLQPIFNSCLINIGDMLDNGTIMNGKLIESPKSFRVACTVTTQIIANVASAQYGGQSVNVAHLGKYLRKSSKKIRKELEEYKEEIPKEIIDKIVEKRLKSELSSGVQTIGYQINTLMTTNGKAPFVTLFLYLDKDDEYIKENAMIIEEILNQRIRGIKDESGDSVTLSFPKLVYVIDENNNLNGGKYDYLTKLAIKCAKERIYPDFISAKMMRKYFSGNVFSPMGCRSFLSPWKDKDGNLKFEGRFNQGVVTINLPQIALFADGNEDKFWDELSERLKVCFEALMCRHYALLGTTSDVSPIHYRYGAIARLESGEKIDSLLKDGYSTISLGYIGLYETTKIMKGTSHTTPDGHEFAVKIMKKLKTAVDSWRKETGLGFVLYGTPAVDVCKKFAEIDMDIYGKVKDVTDKGYYISSFNISKDEEIDVFKKIKLESDYQSLSLGGAISYLDIASIRDDEEKMEELIKAVYENLIYAELNKETSECYEAGFRG
jgi:ribonucleoside-triphosphate reductase